MPIEVSNSGQSSKIIRAEGSARHRQSVASSLRIAFMTARMSVSRMRPPERGGAMNGTINAPSRSIESLG